MMTNRKLLHLAALVVALLVAGLATTTPALAAVDENGQTIAELPAGTMNADEYAEKTGIKPSKLDKEAQKRPGKPGDGVSAARTDDRLKFCWGAGGTYTHCETVSGCETMVVYKNYNDGADQFYDPFETFFRTGHVMAYNRGDTLEVRDAPYRRAGERGVLIYTGGTFGWGWVSRTCLP